MLPKSRVLAQGEGDTFFSFLGRASTRACGSSRVGQNCGDFSDAVIFLFLQILMTYCLALLCEEGIAFASDSRSNAGMDNIAVHRKMHIYETPGDRCICLMSSGNLSLTHSALALIEEDLQRGAASSEPSHLLNQRTLFDTARYVGQKIREVEGLDRKNLEKDDFKFNIHFIVGGQIKGLPHQIFYIYPQGNVMHASIDSPFLQIGESKYGKPILDRGFSYQSPLHEAVKLAVLSMDSTMKSNLSVGPPIDVMCYRTDALQSGEHIRMEEGHPYLRSIRELWGPGLIALVRSIPDLQFDENTAAPREVVLQTEEVTRENAAQVLKKYGGS